MKQFCIFVAIMVVILMSSVATAQVDVIEEFCASVSGVQAFGWVEEITVFYLFQSLPSHIRPWDKLSLCYKDRFDSRI